MSITPCEKHYTDITLYLFFTLTFSVLNASLSGTRCDGTFCRKSSRLAVPPISFKKIDDRGGSEAASFDDVFRQLDPLQFPIHSTDLINQVLQRMPQTECTRLGVNKTTFLTRTKRDVLPDLVRVKIQAFVFDVKNIRSTEKTGSATQHLRQLMKPFQHLLLDPQYSEHTITTYNPFVMQYQVCRQFEGSNANTHMTNSFFVVNDMGAWIDRPLHDRLHRLFFQITSALGIPSITWLPNRVGQLEVCILLLKFTTLYRFICTPMILRNIDVRYVALLSSSSIIH